MVGREQFLTDLLYVIDGVIHDIEQRETTEPDFAVARELAEQLKEEIEAL